VHLADVRDGSENELGPGYWCLMVVAVHRGERQIVPLYQELYPQRAPGFESENEEILRAIRTVAGATGGRGLWVMDRGGDRRRLLVPLLDSGRRLLFRLRGDRHLLAGDERRTAFELAASCRLRHRETVIRREAGDERVLPLRFGARAVHLPERPKVPLYLVVVEGPWLQAILLLTTEKPGRSRRSVWRLVEGYFARWRVEESIRFVKQSYRLEDIRLLRYARLRAMVTLVVAVAYFAAVYLGRRTKLKILACHMLDAAQRIYGIPEFRLYALADGINQILFSSNRSLGPPSVQLGEQFILLPFG
jgi:hypothetical protein